MLQELHNIGTCTYMSLIIMIIQNHDIVLNVGVLGKLIDSLISIIGATQSYESNSFRHIEIVSLLIKGRAAS